MVDFYRVPNSDYCHISELEIGYGMEQYYTGSSFDGWCYIWNGYGIHPLIMVK